jgi:hypothetical protein
VILVDVVIEDSNLLLVPEMEELDLIIDGSLYRLTISRIHD